jgi:aconitate hydratase
MGILPLQFGAGDNAESLGLSGEELYAIRELEAALADGPGGKEVTVVATRPDGGTKEFVSTLRIDTPQEIHYYRNGGILPYVLRQLLEAKS